MAQTKTARGGAAATMALLRRWHVYVSVFVGPSLVFFAITGALQTFRIPDRPDAPAIVQKLARVHKDDVFALKPARPPRPEAKGEHADAKPSARTEAPAAGKGAKPKRASELVKWVFALISVAIAVTTGIGLWMALVYHRERRLIWALFLAGAILPALVLAF